MPARGRTTFSARSILGATLLAGGAAFLLAKAGLWTLMLSQIRVETYAEFLASLPPLAIALLRETIAVVFSRHVYFTLLSGLLVSFWPMLLIVAGASLLIQSRVAGN